MNRGRPKGCLVAIGGNEDKQFAKDVLRRVVDLPEGGSKRVALIPTASSIPKEVTEDYQAAFGKLGIERVDVLDIQKRSEAEDREHAQSAAIGQNCQPASRKRFQAAERLDGRDAELLGERGDAGEDLGQLRARDDAVLDVVVRRDPAHRGERRLPALPDPRALRLGPRDLDGGRAVEAEDIAAGTRRIEST